MRQLWHLLLRSVRRPCRRVAPALLGAAFLWPAAAPSAQPAESASWPVPPSRLELATPYGDLHVKASEYIYEALLLIDDTPVEPRIEGLLNITYAFATPHSLAALISVSNGNDACPIAYRWIVLGEKGYKVSDSFGSCSPKIQVAAEANKLIVTTPNAKKPDKIDTYVYDGKRIRRRGKP